MLSLRLLGFSAVLALAFAATECHALQRVTLRTGFSYDCARIEPVADGKVRLYLTTGAADGYIELASDAVTSVETLPDPPKPVAPSPVPAAHALSTRELLTAAGAEHNIDVDLLASVVNAESGGHEHAVSRTGAQGLMQLMPGTAKTLGVQDAFQPDQNIHGGTAYLDSLLTRYHDNLALALAAYNAGPGAVDKYHGIPPFAETRAYVARVMREFKRRKLQQTAALTSQ